MSTQIRFLIGFVAMAASGLRNPAVAQTRDSIAPPKAAAAASQTIIQPLSRQSDTGMVRRTRVDTTARTRMSDMQGMQMPGKPHSPADSAGMAASAVSQQEAATLMKSMVQLMALQMRMLADPVISQRVHQDTELRRQLNNVIAMMSTEDTTRDTTGVREMPSRRGGASMENMPGMKMTTPSSSSSGTRRPATAPAKTRSTPVKAVPKAKTDTAKAGHGNMTMPGMNMPATKKP